MTGSRKLYAMPPIYRRWERHLISVGLVAYWVRFGLGLVAFPFVYTWWRMKRDPYRRESLSLATILAYFPNFPNFSILSYRCIILIWSFFYFYIYTSYNFFTYTSFFFFPSCYWKHLFIHQVDYIILWILYERYAVCLSHDH